MTDTGTTDWQSSASSLLSSFHVLCEGYRTYGDDDSDVVDGGVVKVTINVPEEIIVELLHFRGNSFCCKACFLCSVPEEG